MSNSTKSFLRLSNATGIRRFGEHLTWIQDPDIFHMRLVGTLEVDDFRKIVSWIAEWGSSKTRFFIICDLSQLQSISLGTRQFSKGKGSATPPNAVTLVYGASFTLRVLTEMSIRARRAMRLPDIANVTFVENQAEALAMLEKMRQNT